MGSFTLEDLNSYEKSFKTSVAAPVVAAEPPPVVPDVPVELKPETPPVEGDVVVAADSTPPVADEPAPEAPPKGSARERIEELVAERNALKKYVEYRDSLEQQRPVAAPAAAPAAALASEAAPTLESCQFDTDKWTKEMNFWTQKQIQAGVKQALQTEKQTATVETQKAKFEERMESFAKATPDVKVVLGNPALPRLAPEAASLVVASDLGPQILYHLGKNPEKAARIARQSPIEQAAAVGRLEAELKAPKPQRLSNAPSPPTPTKGAAGAPISTTDPKMGLKEFMERERQALIEKRRRH